jgi:hypothetical protein
VLTHTIYEAVKERKEQRAAAAAAASAKGGDEAEAKAEEEKSNSSRRVDFIDLFLEAEDDAVQFGNDNKAYNKAEKVNQQQ